MKERMMKIETMIDDHIKTEEKYQVNMTNQMSELHNKIDGLDERYASKDSVKWVYGIISGIILAVIGAVLSGQITIG